MRVWTDFGGGVTRTAEWRATINEMGEIPVLEEDGARLTQTGAPLLLRLAERYGRLGGASDAERFEVLRWLFWDNHKLTGYMATYRFQRAFTPSPDPAVLDYFRRRLDDFLGILDGHLRDRPFVVGEGPTIADVSMSGYLCFPKHEAGYNLAGQPSGHRRLAVASRRRSGMAGAEYDLLPGKRLHCYVS